MKVMGIDPGINGAVAIYDGAIVKVWDMPTKTVRRGNISRGKNKGKARLVPTLDEDAFADLIDELADEVLCAFLEQVHAMPKQGVTSVFSFGQIYGATRMALAFSGIDFLTIAPQRWKGAMGCGANKDSALIACLDKFGDKHNHLWFSAARQGTKDGRCEAALIALYGWNYMQRTKK
jgi:crossover junction endodeoxyribonuclease RuvC